MISTDKSKELACYLDSKYIRFIKLSVTHQKLHAWENYTDFWKGEKHPVKLKGSKWKSLHQIQRIRESYRISFKLPSAKMCNFASFFPKRRITDAGLFLFLQGWSHRTNSPRISWKSSFEQKLKVLAPFLRERKDWRTNSPLPPTLFSQSRPIKTFRYLFYSK